MLAGYLRDERGPHRRERRPRANRCSPPAMSLARLWRGQGRRAEAQALLAPVYGWFTEALDSPDLVAAQKLLAAIGGNFQTG